MSGPIIGTDGKRYPDLWLSPDDRLSLAAAVHQLHCAEGLSVRKVLARIEDAHGIRRSVGWAAGVIKTQRCERCSGVRTGTPEQAPRRVKVQGDLFHGRVPDSAVYVGRAAAGLKRSAYANPYSLKRHSLDESRRLFRQLLPTLDLTPLRGRDLACWCALDFPWCHGGDLIEAANRDTKAQNETPDTKDIPDE